MAEKTHKFPISKQELLNETHIQLKFLRKYCDLFDEGDYDYGKEIATKLRVLLYDSRSCTSVLKQLEREFFFDRPDFIDLSTVGGEIPNKESADFVRCILCVYMLNHQVDSPPVLTPKAVEPEQGKRYPIRAFKTWWEKESVLSINKDFYWNRRQVVAYMADQDGGAHVDPEIDEALALLKRNQAIPLRLSVLSPDGKPKEYVAQINQILGAAVRTIATETLYVFNKQIIPRCERYNS